MPVLVLVSPLQLDAFIHQYYQSMGLSLFPASYSLQLKRSILRTNEALPNGAYPTIDLQTFNTNLYSLGVRGFSGGGKLPPPGLAYVRPKFSPDFNANNL